MMREADEISQRPMMIAPPRRGDAGPIGDRAMSLISVYRAVHVHATVAVQLSLDSYRGSRVVDPAPSILRRPDVDTNREIFVEYTSNCLWLTGNAFWRKLRAPSSSSTPGAVVSVTPLNPNEVHVSEDAKTRRPVYQYRGETIPEGDIQHLKMLRVPGHVRGLGPIQAARMELEGALDARDYGNSWFQEGQQPSGILSSDQVLTAEAAQDYKQRWEDAPGHGVRVLGSGLNYEPMLLKPADVQFLETQKFSTTQVARLFGVPASVMLAAVEGQSRVYSNVLEEWRSYLQFSAMKPLREIETNLSDLLPGPQTARFNLEGFLRLDTARRYEAHRTGIEAGFLTVDEVREIENLPPLTDAQRDELNETRETRA